MLPDEVLGIVASFFVARNRDIDLFAAVGWSWIRALAAAEDIWEVADARRAMTQSLVNPALDNDMWMCDIDGLRENPQSRKRTTSCDFQYHSFLGRAVLMERAAVSQGLNWLQINGERGMRGLECFEALMEQIAPSDLKVLTVVIENKTDGNSNDDNDLLSSKVGELVARLTGLESLRLSISVPSDAALDTALLASANTLKVLHVPSWAAMSTALHELPNLLVLWVTDISNEKPATEPDYYLPNINHMHQLEELRLQGKRRPLTAGNYDWPAMLPRLTSLRTLEVADKLHQRDMSFDGMACSETLTFLNMSWVCHVTPSTTKSIASNFPMLKVLHLTMCTEIETEGYAAVASLRHLERLEVWEGDTRFDQIAALRPAKSLQLLSICGADLDDVDPAIGFLDVFASFPALTALEIADNYFPDGPAVSQLVDALPSCPKLQFLDLSSLGRRGMTDMQNRAYDLDTEALAHLVDLRSLDISGTGSTLRTQQSLANLHHLQVLFLGKGDVSVPALIETVKSNAKSLRHLSINHVQSELSAKDIVMVGQIAHHLRKLDLQGTNCWDDFSTVIEAARSSPPHRLPYPSLAELDVGGSDSLRDADLIAWCATCPGLSRLTANNCRCITTSCLPALAQTRLTHLNLIACRMFCLDVAEEILQSCWDLQSLLATHHEEFVPSSLPVLGKKYANIARLVKAHPSLDVLKLDDSQSAFKAKLQLARPHLLQR